MSDAGLSARRADALRALAYRPSTRPARYPGETPPSGDLPDNPDLAARMLNARYRDLAEPAPAEEPTR